MSNQNLGASLIVAALILAFVTPVVFLTLQSIPLEKMLGDAEAVINGTFDDLQSGAEQREQMEQAEKLAAQAQDARDRSMVTAVEDLVEEHFGSARTDLQAEHFRGAVWQVTGEAVKPASVKRVHAQLWVVGDQSQVAFLQLGADRVFEQEELILQIEELLQQ